MPRARKIDQNQTIIVKQLRKTGCSVLVLSMVGKGCPDLLVGRAGRNYLIELKNNLLSASRKQLTDDEKDFHDSWNGQVNKCESFDEIANIIGL